MSLRSGSGRAHGTHVKLLQLEELNRDHLERLRDDAMRDGDKDAEDMARVGIRHLDDHKEWSEAMAWCLQEINTRRLGNKREGGVINDL